MASMRFSIRDLLLLTVIVALSVSWWIDNKRIETAVAKLNQDRSLLQADFEDRMTVLDDAQKKLRDEQWGRLVRRKMSSEPAKKP